MKDIVNKFSVGGMEVNIMPVAEGDFFSKFDESTLPPSLPILALRGRSILSPSAGKSLSGLSVMSRKGTAFSVPFRKLTSL